MAPEATSPLAQKSIEHVPGLVVSKPLSHPAEKRQIQGLHGVAHLVVMRISHP